MTRPANVAPRHAARRAVELTRMLVRVPSVNPDDGEAAMADCVERWLTAHTAAALTRVETAPGRPSLAAVVRGALPGPTLVLNGHTDTVPLGDLAAWTVDPFAAELRDGAIYGRGACDMKAGLAVAMAVLEHASQRRRELTGTIVAHFAVGEERGERGTESLLEAGFGGDVAIVLEPTAMGVATAGRGLASLDVTVRGESGHAGSPLTTRNPIAGLAALIGACAAHAETSAAPEHPLLGAGRCTPTIVAAGVAPNAVPDLATATIDRRLVPGEEVGADARRLADALRAGLPEGLSAEVTVRPGSFPPVELPDGPFADLLRAAVERRTGRRPPAWATPYATDLSRMAGQIGEGVVFGPGDIASAHAPDERVSVAEIALVADCVLDVVERLAKIG